MRKTGWRIAQGVAGALILVFLVRSILGDWKTVREQPIQWEIHWEYIVASLIVTWAMYGVLIWGWRAVLHGWRERLRMAEAARIWTISSLGKYIPGKVWSIAGMAIMSQERGVSGAAATGSAVIMQLVSLAAGAMVALALTGTELLDRLVGGYGSVAAIALAAASLLAAVALTSPSLTRRIGFLIRRPDAVRPVDPNALAGALFANLAAWGGYGISLQLLALGTPARRQPLVVQCNGRLCCVVHHRIPDTLPPRRIRRARRGHDPLAEGFHRTRPGSCAGRRIASHADGQRNRGGVAVPPLPEKAA